MQSPNEKVMKSEIKNGVLIRADDEDIDKNGHFQCLEVAKVASNAFSKCEKPLRSVCLPNLTTICNNSFLTNTFLTTKWHVNPLITLEVNHGVKIEKLGLYDSLSLKSLILHGAVNHQDIMRLNRQLPPPLKNVEIVFATFKSFLQTKAMLESYFPKDLADMIHRIHSALPAALDKGEPLQSIMCQLDDIFSVEIEMENYNELIPSHKMSNKKSNLVTSGLFSINHEKPIYTILENGIKSAKAAGNTYLEKNKNKKTDGVARAEQLNYVISSTSASRECLAVVIHAFLNENTGGGWFGGAFLNSKGTELVQLLRNSIPFKEQKTIGEVAVYVLGKMGMKTPQEQADFENQIIKNINEGKYDIPNLQLQDEQILAIYGDRKMSDFSRSPKQP